jgi:6-phosphofructokinase
MFLGLILKDTFMKNLLYAQSGGVTSVINASAAGVIETARKFPHEIDKIYAGLNGIIGVLQEEIIDTSHESHECIHNLNFTPAGAFGSCRYKLKSIEQNKREYERIIEVFKAHNIGYFLYNGGGDSQDTAHKLSQISRNLGYPVTCIGIPKTIDNDLPFTDCSPGFGSVAKYVAVSIMEAGLDVESMAKSSTKVFILEVMGRHAGWIAAASGLANENNAKLPPHIILFPEIVFDETKFLAQVEHCVQTYGYCAIVASEGIKDSNSNFLSESNSKDAFGHAQLGGVAATLAKLVGDKLKFKYHYAIADYLQRSARHIASKTDIEQAYAVGAHAVHFALAGQNSTMPIIVRTSSSPYKWEIGSIELASVANVEHKMPRHYISANGFEITNECRAYLLPLIQGESHPEYINGLPRYTRLKNILIAKKLAPFKV